MGEINKIKANYDKTSGTRQKYLLDYYSGDKNVIPVYKRTASSILKQSTHTNVHINFFEDIIARKVGYAGQDIQFSFAEKLEEDKQTIFDAFLKDTKQAISNSESMSLSSVQGISHRLCYTVDGIFNIKNIEGEKVIYDYSNDIFNPNKAYYFYRVTELNGDFVDKCDIYNKTYVEYYIKAKGTDDYTKDPSKTVNPQAHNFNQVPMIPFINNAAWKSDCEDTTELMDLYDEIISDTAGELKAARLAYLKIWGDLYTGEDSKGEPISIPTYLKEFGTMLFGTDDVGGKLGDAQFLEKKLDDTAINNMLDRLRGHVFEQSGSVDLKDVTDSNNARIVQIEASLSRLRQNAEVTENYFKMGLHKQFELWAYIVKGRTGVIIPIDELLIKFVKSFTEDKTEKAKILAILLLSMSPLDAYTEAGYKNAKELAERYEEANAFVVEKKVLN